MASAFVSPRITASAPIAATSTRAPTCPTPPRPRISTWSSKTTRRALLDAAIRTLDDDKRAVFVLFELEELPMAEVAEAVGCPPQTAYARLYAGRRTVEAALRRATAGRRTP